MYALAPESSSPALQLGEVRRPYISSSLTYACFRNIARWYRLLAGQTADRMVDGAGGAWPGTKKRGYYAAVCGMHADRMPKASTSLPAGTWVNVPNALGIDYPSLNAPLSAHDFWLRDHAKYPYTA